MIAEQMHRLENAKRAVITVGDGRGFIIDTEPRLVVSAAHCLPHLPPANGASYLGDRTYQELLGPLGEQQPTVWAECMFVDPVADIAVLGKPDDQELQEQADAYDLLVELATAVRIDDPPAHTTAWLLGLDGRWDRCIVEHHGSALWIREATSGIFGGMSGSPIVNDEGSAIGVTCNSGGSNGTLNIEGGPEPRLTHSLPGWVLLKLRQARYGGGPD